MYLIPATISGLMATGLLVIVRRGRIPRGPGRALAQVAALLAIIVMAGFILSPLGD